ncbi:MAG TPA: hypothetical protein PLO20_15295 [Thermogutta sp.]|nr:hypothetical protein [Thermogutta sp.]
MGSDRITKVNKDWLSRWASGSLESLKPFQAFDIASEWKNLALWWLRQEVLNQAADYADKLGFLEASARWRNEPQLPNNCGACWIALVNKEAETWGLLRPALPFPLQWKKDQQHDTRLPQGLQVLATKVVQALQDLEEITGQWGLHPNPESLLTDLDLSGLETSWDSGWVPLAVGLLLASWEGTPDTSLWSSGGWDSQNGVQNVNGLELKLELAINFNARAFFIPENQLTQVPQEWVTSRGGSLRLLPLRQQTTDLLIALGEYLKELELPIGRGSHLDERRAKFFLNIQDEKTAMRFYRKHVLPNVSERLRRQILGELIAESKKLITIVSQSYDLVLLAALTLQPTECLLLHDKDLESNAIELHDLLTQKVPGCRPVRGLLDGRSRPELFQAIKQHVIQFAGSASPEDLIFDVTAGKRIMNLALYDAAPPSSYVVCFQAEYKNRRPVPFTEVVHVWRKDCESMLDSVPAGRRPAVDGTDLYSDQQQYEA